MSYPNYSGSSQPNVFMQNLSRYGAQPQASVPYAGIRDANTYGVGMGQPVQSNPVAEVFAGPQSTMDPSGGMGGMSGAMPFNDFGESLQFGGGAPANNPGGIAALNKGGINWLTKTDPMTNVTQQGMLSPMLGAAQGLASAYFGMKNYGLAGDRQEAVPDAVGCEQVADQCAA